MLRLALIGLIGVFGAQAAYAQDSGWVDPPSVQDGGAAPAPAPEAEAVPGLSAGMPSVVEDAGQAEPAPAAQARRAERPARPKAREAARKREERAVRRPARQPPAVARRQVHPPLDPALYPEAAGNIAALYLRHWSAPNREAMRAMPGFYADQVVFHGRRVSSAALMREKARFAARWPVRDYNPVPGGMRVACERGTDLCRVSAAFDYVAMSHARGRQSSGRGVLELGIRMAGPSPEIVYESSRVVGRPGVAWGYAR